MRHEGTINKMAGGCAPWNRFGARWRRISRGKEALAHEIWRGENLLPLAMTVRTTEAKPSHLAKISSMSSLFQEISLSLLSLYPPNHQKF